jgi:AP-3 complex subunit delta-1
MLATNLIKKDLSSTRYQEAAIALHTLAQIVTPDLARDLLPDILGLLKHSQASLRKRAILVLFRMFVKWPEGLKAGLPKLQERLSDPEPSVVAAAVNVICELATRTPRTYLPLVPTLYGLLTSIQNNWVLIKLVKLVRSSQPGTEARIFSF